MLEIKTYFSDQIATFWGSEELAGAHRTKGLCILLSFKWTPVLPVDFRDRTCTRAM
jgi:hypothetical protein